ncbi:MAG: FAD-binding protein, partial [Magnetococcales bacterium]|nr:FAD-binding protein [Magnetococcales bacterium]
QRMNRILQVNPVDRWVKVEPGVVNGDLQNHLRPHGLFWPPDPSSARTCTIGGNLAMCSAGPGAVRYGVTRDWVLGLTAILADGRLLQTGGLTSKNVVGLDLTRLLIGSEGMLAVVVEATLRLAPLPAAKRLLRALYGSVVNATHAVAALLNQGVAPDAVEFLDGASLDLLRKSKAIALDEAARALLLVEVSGRVEEVDDLARRGQEILEQFDAIEVLRAGDEAESARIWQARAALSPTLKKLAPRRINEDVVVPVSRLPELMDGLAEISQQWQMPMVNFGHAGNGNIHVNLLTSQTVEQVLPILQEIFQLVRKLDGSLSGEHGIGIQKRPFLSLELDEVSLQLQRAIKDAFDPKGILNPDKVFPPSPL